MDLCILGRKVLRNWSCSLFSQSPTQVSRSGWIFVYWEGRCCGIGLALFSHNRLRKFLGRDGSLYIGKEGAAELVLLSFLTIAYASFSVGMDLCILGRKVLRNWSCSLFSQSPTQVSRLGW